MKANLHGCIFIFLMGLVAPVFSQTSKDVKEEFLKANEMYRKESYEKAIEIYQSIIDKGYESTELHYNVANAYYKLNQIAPSIFHYEKALQIDPANEDAKINLEFAKKMCLDIIEPLPDTLWQRFLKKYIFTISNEIWAWVCIGLSQLFVLFFLLFYFAKATAKRRLFFSIFSFSFLFLAIVFVLSWQQNYYHQHNRLAIIFQKKVAVQDAPNEHSNTVFSLHEGTKVLVLDQVSDWKKIKIADGQIGWIERNALKELHRFIKN